jgi:hypothetical protein
MLDVRTPVTATIRLTILLPLLLSILLTITCGPRSSPADKKEGVFWRRLGSWSGHGNAQTDSFTSDSGSLRVRWEARPGIPGNNAAPAGPGTFRVTAQSAISGRPLKVAVDQRGAGRGTSYVDADPHVFYMVVESANLDWSLTVEEAFEGTASTGSTGTGSDPAGKH